MEALPMTYHSKINSTIMRLPSSYQPLFQDAIVKHSFNFDTLSSDDKGVKGKGNKKVRITMKGEGETFYQKYLTNAKNVPNLKQENDNFRKIYSNIKKDNHRVEEVYGKEVEEYDKRGYSRNELISSQSIFLPSLILEKTENISKTLKILNKKEARREEEFVERCSEVMLNVNKKDSDIKQAKSRNSEMKMRNNSIFPGNTISGNLHAENKRLIKEIRNSNGVLNSLSSLPEYCMTTMNTKESSNTKQNKDLKLNVDNTPQNTITKRRESIKTITTKSNLKLKNINQKRTLAKLYNRLLKNKLTEEHKNIIKYFKNSDTKQHIPPVK